MAQARVATVNVADVAYVEKISDVVTENAGQWFDVLLGTPLRIVLILVISLIVVTVLRRIIHRVENRVADGSFPARGPVSRLARSDVIRAVATASPAAVARRAQRARTLGSVLRSTVSLLVGGVAVLMVLSEVGVNVAPLLASAGVMGVALGFGAQSLVKDFLSGLFMMVEDQYGVGDVVDLGEASGTVEAVGLRVTRIRSLDGTVWYVRNGEVLRVGNMTQGWSRAVIDLRVDAQTDLAAAEEIVRRVAATFAADEQWAPFLIDEPSYTGIEEIGGEAVKLRLLVKTQPSQQWAVAREVRRRLKTELDAAGLQLAVSKVNLSTGPRDAASGPAN